ncbi:MAG: DUF4158 domain-containing protein [Thermaceae bacterium]|nr:DUF4158 domain-containing protein [Thermaceae bacterium]
MPFEFLSDDHLARYGQFDGDPNPQQLMDYFKLSEHDFKLVHLKMGLHTRLGMAIQLGTLRFLGTFLSDPTAVPKVVVRYVAEQLDIRDARILGRYLSRHTRFEHAKTIRDHLGYKAFDPFEAFRLHRMLYARLLVTDERPIKLFDECTRAGWCCRGQRPRRGWGWKSESRCPSASRRLRPCRNHASDSPP